MPEFQRATLEALRQPLETARATVARVNAHVTYPARVQLVAAMNPCRCGHLDDAALACGKAPRCAQDYQSRISGPLFDRIDLHIDVPAVKAADLALPPLDPAEALEISMIHSVAGLLHEGRLMRQRPFRDPHHSASLPALIGGGHRGRPGEISLAHLGILFLDELPEFQRATLEALRQPLETARATGARGNAHVTYPARASPRPDFTGSHAAWPPRRDAGSSRCRSSPPQEAACPAAPRPRSRSSSASTPPTSPPRWWTSSARPSTSCKLR